MYPYRPANNVFEQQYHVNSTGYAGKEVTSGDKIFLPPSAFERLARMAVDYPMLFEVTNNRNGRRTHCGVLEFSSDEGFTYMPFGMMRNLGLDETNLVTVKNVSLRKATFVKFQAQSVDFLEVANPRALLEVALRAYTCLTVGDIVRIPHAGRNFDLEVREVVPDGQASIIETDCNVDFEEPVGYKESKYAEYERKKQEENAKKAADAAAAEAASRTLQKARVESETGQAKFTPFAGSAKRIDGKQASSGSASTVKANGSSLSTASAAALSSESKTESKIEAPESKTAVFYESKIGEKYSKKKTSVSAFVGTARKLSG